MMRFLLVVLVLGGLAGGGVVVQQEKAALEHRLALLETQWQKHGAHWDGQRAELDAVTKRLQEVEANAVREPPLRLEHGNVAAKPEDKEWKLANLFSRTREFRQRVAFVTPFEKPPQVMLGIVLLDLQHDKIRFHAVPEAIDARGFTMLFESRAEERPREVKVEWLAFGR
ncbi:MAG: H-type lectin domain-containing protein [Magnetococcales bacterium]|nr:H-type lectin domain-containing protein [Magnetococcales bacterium]